MRSRFAVVALLLGLANAGQAGDYGLTVADDPNSPCARPGQARAASWPVVSGTEVGQDVLRYFSGQAPRLGLFSAAFGNARVTFCGARERGEVYEALVQVAVSGATVNESHLYGFAMMLGSKRLLDMIDARLQDAAVSPPVAERLRRMRGAVEEGMKKRDGRAA